MHAGPSHTALRWILSVGFTFAAVATTWVLSLFIPLSLHFSPASVTADIGGDSQGPTPDPIFAGFSGNADGSSGFIDSLVLDGNGAVGDVFFRVVGMSPGQHDTVQLLANYDPSTIEITGAECSGLFDSGFSPGDPVMLSPGQVTFMCGSEGGVSGESGTVMRLSLERTAPGESVIEIATDGQFGSRIFAAGVGSSLTPVGSVTLLELSPTPTPVATPTTPPSSGSPGGGATPPQTAPGPTPSLSLPGIPTGLFAIPGDGEVRLSWNLPANNGGAPINENLVRSADGQINRRFTVSQNPVVISGLVNGREYSFRVQSLNVVGSGAFSDFSEPVVPAGPPSAPQALVAKFLAETRAITLEWKPPDDSNGAEIEEYELREATGLLDHVVLRAGTFSHTYTGISPGNYRFLVTATNRGGNGPSAEAAVNVALQVQQPDETETFEPQAELEPIIAEAASQLQKATGTSVIVTDAPLVVQPQEGSLRVVLPVEVSASAGVGLSSEEFTGFTLADLTVEANEGSPSRATLSSAQGVEVSGDVTFHTGERTVHAELTNLTLRLTPPRSSPAPGSDNFQLALDPVFETSIVSIREVPELAVRQLDLAGSPELPAGSELQALLHAHGWQISGGVPGTRGLGWKIEHSQDAFVAGDTVFSFTLGVPGDTDLTVVVVKQSDSGTVYARQAECETAGSIPTRCSAVFSGEAGGFSSFGVFEVTHIEEPAESELATPDSGAPDSEEEKAATSIQPGESALTIPIPTALVPARPDLGEPSEHAEASPAFDETTGNSSSVVVLVALGAVGITVFGGLFGYLFVHIRGRTTVGALLAILVAASALLQITPASHSGGQTASASGVVTSQGDAAQLSDVVRSGFGVDGSGITVGIISDSIGCDPSQLAADITAGELPADLDIRSDVSSTWCGIATDRGRALAQVVHDVAPGAQILFSSAFATRDELVVQIETLVNAGVDIIVDDRIFTEELIFQDDDTVQAVNEASAAGVVYITSAGDTGVASYESLYVSGGVVGPVCGSSGTCTEAGDWHDFDPGSGVDQLLDVSLSEPVVSLVLQWDEPSPGATSDVELYVFDQAGETIAVADTANAINGIPRERTVVIGHDSVQIAISHRSGPVPNNLKLVAMNGAVINEFTTDSSTIIGHRNAAGAITVGPVNYANTAAFGGVTAVEESAPTGGTELLFDSGGNTLDEPVVRQKPDIVGPSGNETTLGTLDGSPAAAAHVAGAVALLLELRSDLHQSGQLDPEMVRHVLSQTAVDVGSDGPDLQSGFGLIDVQAAANMLSIEPPIAAGDDYSVEVADVLTVAAPGILSNDQDQDIPGLVATLVAGPTGGVLDLQSDGSFIYTPSGTFVGNDTFTYVAGDGIFTSAPATVTITVTGIESVASSVNLQGVDSLADFGIDTIYVVLSHDSGMVETELVPGGAPSLMFSGLPPGTHGLTAYAPGFLIAGRAIELGNTPGETVFIEPVQLRAGDADSDGQVDDVDAVIVASSYGTSHSPGDRRNSLGEIVDMNGDGVTNGADASLTISNIGLTEPMPWTE